MADERQQLDETARRVSGLVQAASYVQAAVQAIKLAREVYGRIGRDDAELAASEDDLADERQELQDEHETIQRVAQERIDASNRQANENELAQANEQLAKEQAETLRAHKERIEANQREEPDDPVERELAKERERGER